MLSLNLTPNNPYWNGVQFDFGTEESYLVAINSSTSLLTRFILLDVTLKDIKDQYERHMNIVSNDI